MLNHEMDRLDLVLRRMGSRLTIEEKQTIQRQLRGFYGELLLGEWLEEQLGKQWQVYYNLNLNLDSLRQYDFILVAKGCCLVVECKHYPGHLTYKDHQYYLGNQPLGGNIMQAMTDRTQAMRRLVGHQMRVEGVMIFTHEESSFDLPNLPDFTLIPRPRVQNYLNALNKQHLQATTDQEFVYFNNLITKHRTTNPYHHPGQTIDDWCKLSTGIDCASCASTHIEVQHHCTFCLFCGNQEQKQDLILRSARELTVLFPQEDQIITTSRVHQYLGQRVRRVTVQTTLSKHLIQHGSNRNRYYEYSKPDREFNSKGLSLRLSQANITKRSHRPPKRNFRFLYGS
ncbi:nuclease-related domain-containing protein [Hutsoniella sourekii]